MGRLVILSGPSCAGKSPLHAALRKFHPDLAGPLRTIVLYNSRAPRPGEADGADYHFRPRAEIERLRESEGFIVMDVRGDVQALELAAVERLLAAGDAFFEGNPFVGSRLLQAPLPEGAARLSVFLAPLSRLEIIELRAPERRVDLEVFVTDVMRRKLLRRTRRQKGILSLKDLEEVERRASSAYAELKLAPGFDFVLPNHDGEDSENWDAFYYPLADARRTLAAFVNILQGRTPQAAERWEEGLLP